MTSSSPWAANPSQCQRLGGGDPAEAFDERIERARQEPGFGAARSRSARSRSDRRHAVRARSCARACCVRVDGNSAAGACKDSDGIARARRSHERRIVVEQAIEIGALLQDHDHVGGQREASVTSSRKRAPSVTERSRSSVGLTRSLVAP